MKTILTLVICLSQWAATAQVMATWKGGSPGRETEWQCPGNWNTNRTPDQFNNVHIPDVSAGSGSFPVIEGDAGSVNALVVAAGAKLMIAPSGSLVVEWAESTLVSGDLLNDGRFEVLPVPPASASNHRSKTASATKHQKFWSSLSAAETLDGF
ncbi:MAG: hypothetical protein HY842_04555 [Bacteroidetes bacterium]|nr:hypothetical protein [Bacteroidota bacterium]